MYLLMFHGLEHNLVKILCLGSYPVFERWKINLQNLLNVKSQKMLLKNH